MKYSDEAVEKLIEYVSSEGGFCPSKIGLEEPARKISWTTGSCISLNCIGCWKQALKRKPQNDKQALAGDKQ